MSVPNLSGAVRGWTKQTTIKVTTQSVGAGGIVSESTSSITAPMNFQPMPPATVARKTEEQRTWSWWSIIIRSRTVLLKTDDIVVRANGQEFKIEKANDWRESGFTKYEAIENYTEVST